jgi:hypothetical protein
LRRLLFASGICLRRVAQVGTAGFDPARVRIVPEARFQRPFRYRLGDPVLSRAKRVRPSHGRPIRGRGGNGRPSGFKLRRYQRASSSLAARTRHAPVDQFGRSHLA